jgi:hypothetical protein
MQQMACVLPSTTAFTSPRQPIVDATESASLRHIVDNTFAAQAIQPGSPG